jgi:hypothetical protein
MNAAHLLLTHDHGTPDEIVRIAHETFPGGIDLDPGSHPKWNERIRARRILTEQDDARVAEWFHGAPLPAQLDADRRVAPDEHPGETVFCNPGNDRQGMLVAFYWRTIVEYWLRGWCRSAIYVGFNIEQLSRLQRVNARRSPLQYPTIVPRYRPKYLSGVTLRPQDQPAHASFITLLSNTPSEIRTFIALGREIGDVIGPLV